MADYSAQRLRLADVLDSAAELSRMHTSALETRSRDVLHVASALKLKARLLVTYDQRQSRLAEACGLIPIQP